jgi:hypothetical protein
MRLYLNVTSIYSDFSTIINVFFKKSEVEVNVKNEKLFFQFTNSFPYNPFYTNKVSNETASSIKISYGFFECTRHLRFYLKCINYALAEGGELEIQFKTTKSLYRPGQMIRPFAFFMNEYSLSISESVKLLSVTTEKGMKVMRFKKEIKPYRHDGNNKWSFGIVSNGNAESLKNIEKIIEQIKSFQIKELQIMICGPFSKIKNAFGQDIEIIPDDDLDSGLRVPISSKKNKLILNAKYENLVIQHDRILYSQNWYEQIVQYGNCFDFLCPSIYDYDKKKFRILDWVKLVGDISNFSKTALILDAKTKWSSDNYIDGGLFVGKRSCFKAILFDERLHWGEMEDVFFAKQIYIKGFMILPANKIVNYTLTRTHKPGIFSKIYFFKTFLFRKIVFK